MNRRVFLRHSALISAAAWIGSRFQTGAAPSVRLLDTRVISHQPEVYHGWPTLTRCRNGRLLLAFSGGRESHVCPFGRVELMSSSDDGQSWGWPQVLLDSPIDDRDAGVLETARGSILVTTFTSLAYEAPLKNMAGRSAGSDPKRLAAWQAAHNRVNDHQRRAELGQWMVRSTDGGVTWSARYPTIVNSPHGPARLSNGTLLYAGKELWSPAKRVGVCVSTDDGQSWHWRSEIPARPGDDPADYHELHAVETGDGRILVQIRNHNKQNDRETLQTESSDEGKTWSMPRAIGVWGLPSFLLRLRDGRLLMTYGYRRAPFGNQARLSEDHGRTWSDPLSISSDGTSVDLGYPSTVELADGTLLTVWYELLKGSSRAILRQAHWALA